MTIISEDGKKMINVGAYDIWLAMYSTIITNCAPIKEQIKKAIEFMDEKTCEHNDCLEVARQFNLIRDELSKYPPLEAVYDLNVPEKKAPWEGRISPVVTSCANLFTSADGEDMLGGIVTVCVYGHYAKNRVDIIEE